MGTRRSEGLPSCLCVFCWTMPLQRRFRKLNQGAQYHEFHQICNSGSCHQIKWNIKISVQNLKKGISNTKGGADGQTWRRIKRIEHIFFFLTWYNSLWPWRWLPHRLSKRQSLSTTVLFRTTFTRTIKLNLLLKWLLGSNLSQNL